MYRYNNLPQSIATHIEAIHGVILKTRGLDCKMFTKLLLIDCSESSKSVPTTHIMSSLSNRGLD